MKITLIKPLAAACAAALLSACFTDDEPGKLAKTYNGRLADLDRVPDTTITRPQWRLVVDTVSGDDLAGECTWKGYLGDSAHVGGQAPYAGLYTHPSMEGKKSAQEIRAEGVILSMDTLSQSDTLTHYRADFECEI
jgi:hypothetical protein